MLQFTILLASIKESIIHSFHIVVSILVLRGKELWAKVKSAVKQVHMSSMYVAHIGLLLQTSLGDVLSALGAMPSGFRESTLAHLLSDNGDQHYHKW